MRLTPAVLALTVLPMIAHAEDPTVIDPKALFPEGPVMLEGKLYYAQYSGNVASVWDGKTKADFWKEDGCGPSAVVPVGENFGITCYDNGKLE